MKARRAMRKPSDKERKWAAACHEAGHAVVLNALGWGFDDFCVIRTEPEHWVGHVVPQRQHELPPAIAISVWFAGPLAECCYWSALEESRNMGMQVEDVLAITTFDESDELRALIEDTLRERNNSDVVSTPVPLLVGGRATVHRQATSAFVGDVRRSVEASAAGSIDVQERLHLARRMLCEAGNRQALVELTKYAASAIETNLTVAQVLAHIHRKELVHHLERQPEIAITVLDTSLDVIQSLLTR